MLSLESGAEEAVSPEAHMSILSISFRSHIKPAVTNRKTVPVRRPVFSFARTLAPAPCAALLAHLARLNASADVGFSAALATASPAVRPQFR
jgi:hypothetical protein